MKFHRETHFQNLPARGCLAVACAALFLLTATPAGAQARRTLRGQVPPVVTRLPAVDRLPASTDLHLTIGLPLHNTEALTNLLQQIYDPASPRYHQYLTAEQFTEMFGPTEQEYQTLIAFAQTNGFTITGTN